MVTTRSALLAALTVVVVVIGTGDETVDEAIDDVENVGLVIVVLSDCSPVVLEVAVAASVVEVAAVVEISRIVEVEEAVDEVPETVEISTTVDVERDGVDEVTEGTVFALLEDNIGPVLRQFANDL